MEGNLELKCTGLFPANCAMPLPACSRRSCERNMRSGVSVERRISKSSKRLRSTETPLRTGFLLLTSPAHGSGRLLPNPAGMVGRHFRSFSNLPLGHAAGQRPSAFRVLPFQCLVLLFQPRGRLSTWLVLPSALRVLLFRRLGRLSAPLGQASASAGQAEICQKHQILPIFGVLAHFPQTTGPCSWRANQRRANTRPCFSCSRSRSVWKAPLSPLRQAINQFKRIRNEASFRLFFHSKPNEVFALALKLKRILIGSNMQPNICRTFSL
jgi:hypothetical protein